MLSRVDLKLIILKVILICFIDENVALNSQIIIFKMAVSPLLAPCWKPYVKEEYVYLPSRPIFIWLKLP